MKPGGAPDTSTTSSSDSTHSTEGTPARLWAPWRMRYVVDGVREDGCLFCSRHSSNQDVDSLILHRGERAFIIMNLFPYNTGHVMIVPNAHVASPEDADSETISEFASLRTPLLRALRRALSPEGFNIGMNIGSVAGAGIAAHFHEHVVPRWLGDANFMPILASTMVMPELLPATYGKIRAELAREFGSNGPAISAVVSRNGDQILVESDFSLPRVEVDVGEPVWRALLRSARGRGVEDVELIGWAGDDSAAEGSVALLHQTAASSEAVSTAPQIWLDIETARSGPDGNIVRALLQRFGERL